MASQDLIEAVNLYRRLMIEVRLRIELFNFILAGKSQLSEGAVRELCYLQFRMLTELVAVGCLVIHGDLSATKAKKIANEWSADRIIKQLDGLHPHFYPQPAEVDKRGVTANTKPNAITKSEMIFLYGKCGDALHRGSLRKVLRSQGTNERLDLPEIIKWAQKFEDLLGCHAIVSSDGKTIILCLLRDAGNNMATTTAIIEHP